MPRSNKSSSGNLTVRKLRVCCVFNIAPLYRRAIYQRMSEDPSIDYSFYCGLESPEIEALTDMRRIRGFRRYLANRYSGQKLIWQKGWWRTLFRHYDAYILTGNPGIRSNWLIVLYARITGKKVYLWTHGLYGNETRRQQRINYFYMRLAGNLFLYGNRAKYLLHKKGYPFRRMHVLYNSLDYNRQYALRDKYRNAGYMRNYFGNDYPVIAFVGRLTAAKSLDLLIKAVALLKVQSIDVNIVLLGTGPLKKELEKLAEEVKIDDRIWFYGACYDEEMIASVLQNSTLCVSPGNVGLTAVHALSYGIPVITHNRYSMQMPEYEAIKSGQSGDFFKYSDVFSLSETIEKWLNLLKDGKQAEKIKKNCYKIIDELYNPNRQTYVLNRVLTQEIGLKTQK